MVIVDTTRGEAQESNWEGFYGGKVYTQFVLEGEYPGEKIGVVLVKFDPGAKNKFHTHTVGQVLYVTEGKGIVATREKEVIVTPGTMIYFSPGEEHGIPNRGIDREQMMRQQEAERNAREMSHRYQAQATPSVVINGKYILNPDNSDGNLNEMIKIMNFLIDKERAANKG